MLLVNQASLENGLVLNFDARTLPSDLNEPSPARFTLSAHDGAVASLDVNPHIRGCIVTGGTDKIVKVWNIEEQTGNRAVSLVTSRNLGVVSLYLLAISVLMSMPLDRAKCSLWAGRRMIPLHLWLVAQ
jgi:periodic tryptophan protein 1